VFELPTAIGPPSAHQRDLRIIGLTTERAATFRKCPTKNSGIYAALDQRADVVDVIEIRDRPWLGRLRNAAERFTPFFPSWSPDDFHRRTMRAERALRRQAGEFDLILQLQTLFAPAMDSPPCPYVIYTDNIYLLTRRHYPSWCSMSQQEFVAWNALERQVLHNARFVFAKSEYLRRAIIDDLQCDPGRVIVVGAGANYARNELEEKDYSRQIALFVGIDFERKGGRVLLDAWRHVHSRLPGAELWITGPRPRQVTEGGGIRWLGYMASKEQMRELYHQATLFVMPSLFEPYGLVFLEAMGHGLPCIGTSHCAMPEIIEPGVTGLLVPPGEARPLAESLMWLFGQPEEAAQMGRRALATVQQRFLWSHVAERMVPYLAQAADEARSRSGGPRQPAVTGAPSQQHLGEAAATQALKLLVRRSALVCKRLGRMLAFGGSQPDVGLRDAIATALNPIPRLFFVQIGSNDGVQGDPIHNLIVNHAEWSGIFVEPVPFVFERLKRNYGDATRFVFENVAISDQTEQKDFFYVAEEARKLFQGALPYWYDQLGSFDREHILKHLDGKLAPFIVKEQVQCLPLQTVLERNQVTTIDLLHVDAEGSDFRVLSQFNFNLYAPRIVTYEHAHLSDRERAEAEALLRRHDYRVTRYGGNTLAIRNRPKQSPLPTIREFYRTMARA
jgi:FkbM family methyltransferase